MPTFGQPGYTGAPDGIPQKPIMYVKNGARMRKDGKIKIEYVFSLSNRRFTKLKTFKQYESDRVSGKYKVVIL